MQLMRRRESWDPFRELEDISNRMSRLLGMNLSTSSSSEQEALETTDWAPPCDISETDKEYRVRVALPNVKRENVHVALDRGQLSIRGERREEKEEKSERVHRREISYGSFMRRFSMPSNADESKVEAKFRDGMLHVTIGKSKGADGGQREIAVN